MHMCEPHDRPSPSQRQLGSHVGSLPTGAFTAAGIAAAAAASAVAATAPSRRSRLAARRLTTGLVRHRIRLWSPPPRAASSRCKPARIAAARRSSAASGSRRAHSSCRTSGRPLWLRRQVDWSCQLRFWADTRTLRQSRKVVLGGALGHGKGVWRHGGCQRKRCSLWLVLPPPARGPCARGHQWSRSVHPRVAM